MELYIFPLITDTKLSYLYFKCGQFLHTGFVIIPIMASGHTSAHTSHRSLTIPALVLNRSSLVIPYKEKIIITSYIHNFISKSTSPTEL